MPQRMKLTRKGLVRSDYDPKSKTYVERFVEDPFVYLRYETDLAQNLTLGDICRFVRSNFELAGFLSRYSQCRHMDQFHLELDSLDPHTDLDAIEISWHAGVFDDGHEHTFASVPHISGCKGEENSYGLDFLKLGQIAHLPVRLNTQFRVYGNGEGSKLLLSASSDFSLLEIFNSIYHAISFYGGPEERDKMAEELEIFQEELFEDR